MDIFKHIFFLLALRFRSKFKQDVNISSFVNHFVLKNQRVLDTFLYANQIKHVYLRQNSKFSKFLLPATFLLNDVIGAMLSKLGGSYRLHSFTFYSQLSGRLTIFGLQKQASCGWRLIMQNTIPAI